MSKDKYIFATTGGYCVNYSLNISRNTRGFKIWGISHGYFTVLAGGYLVT